MPETTQALKGRNRRCVNQCAVVSPFQGFGESERRLTQGDRVRPRVALRSTLGYLILPLWGERSGCSCGFLRHCRITPAASIDAKIVWIDGIKLSQLLIDFDVGVSFFPSG